MAGFPHHQLESYLGKLIAAGLRAAVCEQVEDPKLAKGLVRREVTRIVTPGTRHRRRPAGSRGRATTWRRWRPASRRGWRGSSFRRAGSWRPVFPPRQLADQLARHRPGRMPAGRGRRSRCPAQLGRADDGHAAARLGLLAGRRPGRTCCQAFPHGRPGGLRLRRRRGRRPGDPRPPARSSIT